MMTLQEIDNQLTKISGEYSSLVVQEQKLREEKRKLLAKDIIDNKILNKCRWQVEKRHVGFALKPIFDIFDTSRWMIYRQCWIYILTVVSN